MADAPLAAVARQPIRDALGALAPGALWHTYAGGTPTTPLATWSDSALSVLNANPIVADAAGLFGPVYVSPGVSYHFVVTTSTGVPIWDQDHVTSSAGTLAGVASGGTGAVSFTAHGVLLGETTSAIVATAAGAIGYVLTANGPTADPTWQASAIVNDFRLTLTTGTPVTSADVLAATTLYASPYTGRRLTVFDSAGNPLTLASAEVSIAIPNSTSQLYDVFAYSNAGVLTLELLPWTNDTTRATALTLATTGCYTKTGDLTRRYLGSVRTTTVAGQTEDSIAKRYVWNAANRVLRLLRVLEATNSWAYSTNTYRQANSVATNQLDFVVGLAEGVVEAAIVVSTSSTSAISQSWVAIGEDSTTVADVACLVGQGAGFNTSIPNAAPTAALKKIPAVGRHVWVWLEKAVTGVITWYGDNASDGTVSGVHGSLWG